MSKKTQSSKRQGSALSQKSVGHENTRGEVPIRDRAESGKSLLQETQVGSSQPPSPLPSHPLTEEFIWGTTGMTKRGIPGGEDALRTLTSLAPPWKAAEPRGVRSSPAALPYSTLFPSSFRSLSSCHLVLELQSVSLFYTPRLLYCHLRLTYFLPKLL